MPFIRFLACSFTAIVSFAATAAIADEIVCPGEYGGHLQGVATDGKRIYWSFSTEIVSTDTAGKLLAVRKAPYHQGDLCIKDDKVYVAVNLGKFNHRRGAVSQVTAYDADTLEPLQTWNLPDMPHGAGGITWRGDRFFVVGGLPQICEYNYVYEYTPDFKLVKRHDLRTSFTLMGIQTAAYENGKFFFGIYGEKGNPGGVLAVDGTLKGFTRHTGPGSVGIMKLAGRYYTGRAYKGKTPGRNAGSVVPSRDFCGPKSLYKPVKTGGEARIFFAGRDRTGWKDGSYRFNPDGTATLSGFNAVFRPVGSGDGEVIAACIGGTNEYYIPDILRALRRAAEKNESLALCLPGTPLSVADDKNLADALSAIRREAAELGVAVKGL